jgi:hypothetical protein
VRRARPLLPPPLDLLTRSADHLRLSANGVTGARQDASHLVGRRELCEDAAHSEELVVLNFEPVDAAVGVTHLDFVAQRLTSFGRVSPECAPNEQTSHWRHT